MDKYSDTINQIYNYLKGERNRRIKALNSNYFCDNKTLQRNINIISKAMITINNEIASESIKCLKEMI